MNQQPSFVRIVKSLEYDARRQIMNEEISYAKMSF